MKKFNFNEAVINFLLENPNKSYKLKDLASEISKKYPQQAKEKEERSSQKNGKVDFVKQFTNELGGNRRRSILKKDPRIHCYENPLRLIFSEKECENFVETNKGKVAIKLDSQRKKETFNESDLYPILIEKLFNYEMQNRVFSMRIDEKRSKNSHGLKGNKWLHPDIVGAQDLSEDWTKVVKDTAQNKTSCLKLWSFEVKKEILMTNVRECFFQAVSNSSWANFGYLVANRVEDLALEELRLLCPSYGIGFMLLSNEDNDAEDLSSAKINILIPANENKNVDWNIVNRIVKENKDFSTYIGLIDEFYKLNKLKPSSWGLNELEED